MYVVPLHFIHEFIQLSGTGSRMTLRFSLDPNRGVGWEVLVSSDKTHSIMFPVNVWGDLLRSLIAALVFRSWKSEANQGDYSK